MGRKIDIKVKNWKGYVPVFSVPGLAPLALRDNPRIIVHAGYMEYEDRRRCQEYMKKFEGYDEYLGRLVKNAEEAGCEGKTIIAYTPTTHLKETLQVLGHLKNLVLVPTDDRVEVDSKTLGMTSEELHNNFSQYFKKGKICGEFNLGCLDELEADIGIRIALERDYDCIFPSDEQLNEWRCRPPIDDLMTAPQKDYLIMLAPEEECVVKIRDGMKKLGKKLETELHARKGTCFADMLSYMSNKSNIDDEPGERIPYCFLYGDLEKWSASTIRKNIKKMERFGIVSIEKPDEIMKKGFKILAKESKRLKAYARFRKVVVPKININSSELDIDDSKIGKLIVKDLIRSVSTEELQEMRRMEYHTIEEVDIRGMDESERVEATLSMYDHLKRNLFGEKRILPQEKRTGSITQTELSERKAELIVEATSKLKELSHIKEAYLAGSSARSSSGEGDVDLVLVRESCPGLGSCLHTFKKSPMDVFCLTEEEIEKLKERKAVLTAVTKSLK